MAINYYLEVKKNGKYVKMGVLSNNEDGTAVFAPISNNSDITINNFSWSLFGFTLPNAMGDNFPSGDYNFGNRYVRVITGIVTLPAGQREGRWRAEFQPTNPSGTTYTLKIKGATFGDLTAYADGSATFSTPGNGNTKNWGKGQFSWSQFSITLTTAYDNFTTGEYDFSGGNYEKIQGALTFSQGPADPPDDWMATTQSIGG